MSAPPQNFINKSSLKSLVLTCLQSIHEAMENGDPPSLVSFVEIGFPDPFPNLEHFPESQRVPLPKKWEGQCQSCFRFSATELLQHFIDRGWVKFNPPISDPGLTLYPPEKEYDERH